MSGVLIDTNVISETVKPLPNPAVLAWLAEQTPADLYLAAPVLAELFRGAHRHPDKARRTKLIAWISEDLRTQFEGRILSFGDAAAQAWGRIMGEGDRAGTRRSAFDAQIAAIAHVHGLTLATRNEKDFAGLGLPVVNPWDV